MYHIDIPHTYSITIYICVGSNINTVMLPVPKSLGQINGDLEECSTKCVQMIQMEVNLESPLFSNSISSIL